MGLSGFARDGCSHRQADSEVSSGHCALSPARAGRIHDADATAGSPTTREQQEHATSPRWTRSKRMARTPRPFTETGDKGRPCGRSGHRGLSGWPPGRENRSIERHGGGRGPPDAKCRAYPLAFGRRSIRQPRLVFRTSGELASISEKSPTRRRRPSPFAMAPEQSAPETQKPWV